MTEQLDRPRSRDAQKDDYLRHTRMRFTSKGTSETRILAADVLVPRKGGVIIDVHSHEGGTLEEAGANETRRVLQAAMSNLAEDRDAMEDELESLTAYPERHPETHAATADIQEELEDCEVAANKLLATQMKLDDSQTGTTCPSRGLIDLLTKGMAPPQMCACLPTASSSVHSGTASWPPCCS